MSDAGTSTKDRAAAAREWWQGLQPIRDGKPNRNADRGALARLRRSAPDEALTEETTFALYRALRFDRPAALSRVATLAGVLAHVRKDVDAPGGLSFGRCIGRKSFGEQTSAVLSELRFRRLLLAREEADIAREFRRAITLADRSAPVRDLAHVILNWDRDETRRRFAFDYYAAGSAAPANTTEARS